MDLLLARDDDEQENTERPQEDEVAMANFKIRSDYLGAWIHHIKVMVMATA